VRSRTFTCVCACRERAHACRGLCRALELPDGSEPASEEVTKTLVAVYAELAEQFPGCSAVERIPLDFLAGDAFAVAARARIERFAAKGIWALFSDLQPLLDVPEKELVLWREAQQALAAAAGEPAVWLRLYLAQHARYKGDMRGAVEHVVAAEACDAAAGALVEVFCTKADVLAAAGDPEGAARAADIARQLDLQDRYVNSMAAKYMFRNGETAPAKATALLFTRSADPATHGAPGDLFDMQVMWYELESGRAHLKLGDLGMVRPCSHPRACRHPRRRARRAGCRAGAQDVSGDAGAL
jgi:N-alpha-acetyltransferase 15/16, NatA auxiliary subunit